MKSHIKAYGVLPYLVEENDIKILLCKSVMSKDRCGCLKGLKEKSETAFECARREFYEESSINRTLTKEIFIHYNRWMIGGLIGGMMVKY